MRKFAPLIAGIAALVFVPSALATGEKSTLTISVTKTSLNVDIATTTADGSTPAPANNEVLHLGKGLVIDAADPVKCANSQSCDPSTTVGAGKAKGAVVVAPGNVVPAGVNVTAYAGTSNTLILGLSGSLNGALIGTLAPDSNPFGSKLTVPVNIAPPIPGSPAKPSLTDFQTTIGGANCPAFPNSACPDASGTKSTTSTKSFTIKAGATKTVQLPFPLALKFANSKYKGTVKAGKGLKVLSKGSAQGGSVYRAKVKNTGTKAGKVTLTTTTTYPWQYISFSGCTGTMSFESVTSFDDGETTTADTTAPCP